MLRSSLFAPACSSKWLNVQLARMTGMIGVELLEVVTFWSFCACVFFEMVERSTGSHDWHDRSRTPRGGEGWWSRVSRWWSQSSDWWSQGSDWWSQNSARSSADTSQERSSAPTEQLSSENMLVGMMSTVVENRQGAVSRAASYRCMYTCMMYVYVSQLINSLIN